jgi:hypothetical protein
MFLIPALVAIALLLVGIILFVPNHESNESGSDSDHAHRPPASHGRPAGSAGRSEDHRES